MKPIHIPTPDTLGHLDGRHESATRNYPRIEQSYQTSTLRGGCGTPARFRRPSFFEISSDYFAGEAHRGIAIDTAIFGALIFTAVLPIVNSVQAVATLIHTVNLF